MGVLNPIILIGEKSGKEARDNGFYYFKHRMDNGFDNTYFVYDDGNVDFKKIQKYGNNIVLKNSKAHYKIFYKSKYLIVTDGYDDVFPSEKKPLSQGWQPIIYLQHGIISYKQIFFGKGHYLGRIQKFIVSLDSEYQIVNQSLQSQQDLNLTKKLAVKYGSSYYYNYYTKDFLLKLYKQVLLKFYYDHSIKTSKDLNEIKRLIGNIGLHKERILQSGLPRHESLVVPLENREYITFFFSWREKWLTDPQDFLELVEKLVTSDHLKKYVFLNDYKIGFYLHSKIRYLQSDLIERYGNQIKFLGADNFSELLRLTAIFVTDYSSAAFEFNLVKTPVIFLQFDYDEYMADRGHYLKSPYDFYGFVYPSVKQLLGDFNKNKSFISDNKHYENLVKNYPNFQKSCHIIDHEIGKTKKHIIYFCYNIYGVGGTVQTIINQANTLVELGYQVSIISLRRTSHTPELYIDPSIRIEALNDVRAKGKYRTEFENNLASLPSLLFDKSEDLYFGLSALIDYKLVNILKTIDNAYLIATFPSLAKNLLKYNFNKNLIFIQEHKSFFVHSLSIQKMINKYYKNANGIMVLSKSTFNEYESIGCNNVSILPNGIPDKSFLLDGVKSNSFVKKITAFGRLVKDKQYDLLIKAFALISDEFPFWIVEIYGSGPEQENLQKLINDLNLSKKIKILPSTSLVFEIMWESEFCVHPSKIESFGMVYIEAFSLGKTVVSFDIGTGPKEFLVHNENCLLANCFDITDFALQMKILMSDNEKLLRLSKNAREYYLQKYEIKQIVSQLITILDYS